YLFSASHRRVVGTDAAVSQSRQRLECGDSSPLSSASASQLAADPSVPRAKAPTSWRTPNAAATAKPALPLRTHRVRNALNTYPGPRQYGRCKGSGFSQTTSSERRAAGVDRPRSGASVKMLPPEGLKPSTTNPLAEKKGRTKVTP